jgi:hypothetical protein
MKELYDIDLENRKFFEALTFIERPHIYTLDGVKLQSVTRIIKNFQEQVDWVEKAKAVARKETAQTKKVVTPRMVLDKWKGKSELAGKNGQAIHSFAEEEQYYRSPQQKKEEAVLKFFEGLNTGPNRGRYQTISRELRMYHKVHKFSGTLDLIIYDSWEDHDIMPDYKTNEDLFRNFQGKELLYPFSDLLDNPFNLYQIQLNLYEIMYEQTGRRVGEKWIIWLQESGEYELLKVGNYKDRLRTWLTDKTFDNEHDQRSHTESPVLILKGSPVQK